MAAKVVFGQVLVHRSQVFFRSKRSLGIVNIMPVVKGHVLLIPKRKVERFNDLSQEEISDLFDSVQKVSRGLEKQWNPAAFTFAVQDGEAAGQTIRHVHVHVMPRFIGDFKVVRVLEKRKSNVGFGGIETIHFDKENHLNQILDKENHLNQMLDKSLSDMIYSEIEKPRVRRSEQEMAEEASLFSTFFPENQDQFSFEPSEQ